MSLRALDISVSLGQYFQSFSVLEKDPIPINLIPMKKLYLYLLKGEGPISKPLLVICFLGGYLLATMLFYLFGHALKASVQ